VQSVQRMPVDVCLTIIDPDSLNEEIRSNDDYHPLFSLSPISSSDDQNYFAFPADASGYISPRRRISEASSPTTVSTETVSESAQSKEVVQSEMVQSKPVTVSKGSIELVSSFWMTEIETMSMGTRKKLIASMTSEMPQPTALDISESVDMLGWMLRQLKRSPSTARASLHELGAFYESAHALCSEQLTAFFAQMTRAMLSAFTELFADSFSAEVEFALDEVSALVVSEMTSTSE